MPVDKTYNMFPKYLVEDKNGTYSARSQQEDVLFATFYIGVFIFSVPCNALALWVFCHSPSRSPSKVFLLNLAIADMSYMLILPMRVIYHASANDWPLGEGLCRLVGFLFFLNLYCSIYFMTCIGIDRLLAISLPRKLRRRSHAKVCSGVLWVMVACFMAPVLFIPQTMTVHTSGRNVTVCNQLYLENSSPKALASTAVAIAVPLVTLTVSYILIFYKLRTMTFQERTPVQRKAVKMIVLTVVTFMIAFVPYHVHRFIYIKRYSHEHASAPEMRALAFGNRLTSALTCVSGVMDPIMYFFLASNYQKTLLQLCGKARNKDRAPTST